MNFSLKPNTIISHFLPGTFFIVAVVVMILIENTCWIDKATSLPGGLIAVLAGIGFSLALIIGLIFDAIRHLLEPIWDKLGQTDKDGLWWDFFFRGDEKILQNLMDHYYSFYVFDANLVIAILISLFCGVLFLMYEIFFTHEPNEVAHLRILLFGFPLVIIAFILFIDGKNLRKEIKKLATEAIDKEKGGNDAENAA